MQYAGLSAPWREPTRVTPRLGRKTGATTRWSVVLLGLALSGLSPQPPARADGGLETQKGGLFHRKGWITPEIYKARDESNASSDASRPTVTRSASTSGTANTTRRTQTSGRTTRANSAAPRIPRNVVRRREQTVTRSARRPQPAPATATTQVASLTTSLPSSTEQPKQSITGGAPRIQWLASSGCLAPRLRAAINHVALNYGRVRVSSTCRSRRHNRRVGGARRSYHLTGQAADFRVFGNVRGAARYLRSLAGGYKHYGGGLFHIDTGPKRSW